MKVKMMAKVISVVLMMALLMGQTVLACDCECEACSRRTESTDAAQKQNDSTPSRNVSQEQNQNTVLILDAQPSVVLSVEEIRRFVPEDTYLLDLDTGEVFYERDMGEQDNGLQEGIFAAKIIPWHRYEAGFVLRNETGENLKNTRFKSQDMYFLDRLEQGDVYTPYPWDNDTDRKITGTFFSESLGMESGVKTGIPVYAEWPIILKTIGVGHYEVHNTGVADGKELLPGKVGGVNGEEIGLIEKDQTLTYVTTRWKTKPYSR